ncbi:MAG TPA: ABC transporter permease [Bryobacteraceae bacterium]|nr:ABC transporter permease [Bryobacteraceae bacterium]
MLADLRFAVRTLRKSPAWALTVVAALSLCIAFNAAIFSVVDTVLFRPLSFPDQQRLVAVTEGVPGLGFPVMPVSCPDYLFIAANNHSFAATATYRTRLYEISGAGQPHRIYGARITASLFQVLGISPLRGRTFTRAEDEHFKKLAVLTYAFARSTFGSPDRALGRKLFLDRIPYTVIGILPRSFTFPIRGSRFNGDPAGVFVPVSWTSEDRRQNVSNFDDSMIARLRPGVTIPQANAEMKSLVKRIQDDYPPKMKQALSRMKNFSLESQVVPFREEFTGNVQRPLLLLLAAVGIVLLIGCADVANLMFSRMVGRQREFALRAALGAGRWRLARQTITEGLVLSIAGGALGLCLASWTLPLLLHFAPGNLPRINEIGLNWRILFFVAAVTLAAPLVFCLGPLVNTLRSILPGQGRTSTHSRHQRLMMSAAVVTQFSLAFLLLTTAGLLTRSLLKAAEANPGFQPQHLISLRLALPTTIYKTQSQITGFFNSLVARLSTLPGVRQAGTVSDLPAGSSLNVIISIEGHRNQTAKVDTIFCLGNALDTLHIALLRGRLLRPGDQVGGLHPAVISESLAKRVWPHEDPIGRHVRFGVDIPNNREPWITIVGVVADVKARLTSNGPRFLMFMTWPDFRYEGTILIRTAGDPRTLSSVIRREVNRLDPNLPVGKIETVDQILDDSLSAERFRTWLLVSFATAALLLATLGIAGLLAYHTAQRAKEFGVRIALGADRRALLSLVLSHCLRLSGTGIAVGLLASLFVTRTLRALLYDTSPHDIVTFFAVPAILALVALGASLIPAWRAIHTDPITALRTE